MVGLEVTIFEEEERSLAPLASLDDPPVAASLCFDHGFMTKALVKFNDTSCGLRSVGKAKEGKVRQRGLNYGVSDFREGSNLLIDPTARLCALLVLQVRGNEKLHVFSIALRMSNLLRRERARLLNLIENLLPDRPPCL